MTSTCIINIEENISGEDTNQLQADAPEEIHNSPQSLKIDYEKVLSQPVILDESPLTLEAIMTVSSVKNRNFSKIMKKDVQDAQKNILLELFG